MIFLRHIDILKHIVATVALLCLAATVTDAQDRDSVRLTVEDLFRLGMESSLVLKADSLSEMIAEEGVRTARMAKAPDVNVGLKAGYAGQPVVFLHGLTDATFPDSPDWSQNYAVDVSQPLYQGGKIRNTVRKSETQLRIAGMQTESDAADIKLSLIARYLELFCLYKQEDVVRQNIVESERRLKDIRKMADEGLITRNDVLRSELELSNDRMLLLRTGNSIVLASQKLDILLGLDEDLLVVPDSAALAPVSFGDTYQSCLMAAYDMDPSARLARERIVLAENEAAIAKADFLPSISLYAGNTLARPISRTMQDVFCNTWSIGLSVTYPISSLYKNRSRLTAMRQNVALMSNARDRVFQEIRAEVKDAWLRHEESLEQVRTLELSVLQAEENCRIMRNRYFEQLSILTDLLDADNVRLDAELQLISAKTEVIYTYYRLLKACGRL